MKKLLIKLKYKLQALRYWKVLLSPFKPFRIRFYAGKTAIGVPYFFPRRWRKFTEGEAIAAALEAMNKSKLVKLPYEKLLKEYRNYNKAVTLTVGFDACGLGWKTKWSDTDYRYEYGPVLTFVFFGYQLAVSIGHKHANHYWPCWLYYEYQTDKTKSKRERIAECREKFPQTWTVYHSDKTEETIDYYNLILKPKYLK